VILEIADWKFDIDLATTMEYSTAEAADHCDCAYCRNFYKVVDESYPNLRPFLAQFGVDIEAPDELMPFDIGNEMWYYGIYAISGNILSIGSAPLTCDGVEIKAAKDIELHINSECLEPRFFLEVGMIVLPWVLDEPMNDVVSPANLPSFLKKMWNKILDRLPKDNITS
jgi:hypothetical protein